MFFSLCSFKHCLVPTFAFNFYKIRILVCYNSNFLFWQIKRRILHLFHHVHLSPGCLQEVKPMGWFLIELEQKGSSDLPWWCWRLTEQHIRRNKFINKSLTLHFNEVYFQLEKINVIHIYELLFINTFWIVKIHLSIPKDSITS